MSIYMKANKPSYKKAYKLMTTPTILPATPPPPVISYSPTTNGATTICSANTAIMNMVANQTTLLKMNQKLITMITVSTAMLTTVAQGKEAQQHLSYTNIGLIFSTFLTPMDLVPSH